VQSSASGLSRKRAGARREPEPGTNLSAAVEGRRGQPGQAAHIAGIAFTQVPAGLYPISTSGRMGFFAKGSHYREGGQCLQVAGLVSRLPAGGNRALAKTRKLADATNGAARCSGPRP
jgi:hypothetical protein